MCVYERQYLVRFIQQSEKSFIFFILSFRRVHYVLCIFWVIPRRHSANSRRFGTLYQLHLLRQVDKL